jgi:L,D-peptidoglycan transpeptidase YkuD (ErfK/YbiS/YcfS/YnhG family)
LKKSLRAIERAFADIETSFADLANRVRVAEREAGRNVRVTAKPRRLKLTPRRRAQLKLQGAYMGHMRQLKPAQKLRVKAVKEKRGFEAMIGVASSAMTAKHGGSSTPCLTPPSPRRAGS